MFKGLVNLFKNKGKKAVEIQKFSAEELRNLFDSYMETLRERGCPSDIIDNFLEKKSRAIAVALRVKIEKGNIPFLPVISRKKMSVQGMMKMIQRGRKRGHSYLFDETRLGNKDNATTLENFYFIYNVEDGSRTLYQSAEKAENIIEKLKRSCLTVEEGIMLCVLKEHVLLSHNVNCLGTYYENVRKITDIFISSCCENICLGCYYAENSLVRWGTPSCSLRVKF